MTINRPDALWYQNKMHVVICEPDEASFRPEEYGMKPAGITSTSYRGYWADYAIAGKKLLLMSLHIHCSDNRYPPLNGIEAEEPSIEKVMVKRITETGIEESLEERVTNFDYSLYRNVFLPLNLTGKITAGIERAVTSLDSKRIPP